MRGRMSGCEGRALRSIRFLDQRSALMAEVVRPASHGLSCGIRPPAPWARRLHRGSLSRPELLLRNAGSLDSLRRGAAPPSSLEMTALIFHRLPPSASYAYSIPRILA